MELDFRVLELLMSKVCHDLVSPVSAINNGVELIEDIGGSVVDEAMKLIGDSAGQASRRLRLFRIAYGRAGSEESLPVKDVRQTAEQYLGHGKVTLNWLDGQPDASIAARKGVLKVLLNTLILGEEVLAYGGVISLRAAPGALNSCVVEIIGRNAQLSEGMRRALDGVCPIDELTPRTIQAYVVGFLCRYLDLTINYDQSMPDRLLLTLLVSDVGGTTLS